MGRLPSDYEPLYELKMDFVERQKFIQVVDEKMRNRKVNGKLKPMKRIELAREIGVPKQSIYNFFSTEAKPRRFIAASIANYFGLQRKDWLFNDKVKNGKIGKTAAQYNHRPKDNGEHLEGDEGNRN